MSYLSHGSQRGRKSHIGTSHAQNFARAGYAGAILSLRVVIVSERSEPKKFWTILPRTCMSKGTTFVLLGSFAAAAGPGQGLNGIAGTLKAIIEASSVTAGSGFAAGEGVDKLLPEGVRSVQPDRRRKNVDSKTAPRSRISPQSRLIFMVHA